MKTITLPIQVPEWAEWVAQTELGWWGGIWVVERHGTYVYTDSDPDDEWRPYESAGE